MAAESSSKFDTFYVVPWHCVFLQTCQSFRLTHVFAVYGPLTRIYRRPMPICPSVSNIAHTFINTYITCSGHSSLNLLRLAGLYNTIILCYIYRFTSSEVQTKNRGSAYLAAIRP